MKKIKIFINQGRNKKEKVDENLKYKERYKENEEEMKKLKKNSKFKIQKRRERIKRKKEW